MGQQADEDNDDPARGAAQARHAEPDAGPAEDAVPPRRASVVPVRLLLLVTVANLLLTAGLLAVRPPWRAERTTPPPALPAQVAELRARVARGEQGTPYTLTLTDDELTATAQYFLAQRVDVPFTQVRVAVVDGRIEATGVTTGLAVAVPVRVVANVEARNGAPVIAVVDVGLGGLALPAFVREQVLTEANRAVDLSQYNIPVTVESVTFGPGAIDLRGLVR